MARGMIAARLRAPSTVTSEVVPLSAGMRPTAALWRHVAAHDTGHAAEGASNPAPGHAAARAILAKAVCARTQDSAEASLGIATTGSPPDVHRCRT
jgi:hypothetical protein